MADPVKFNFKEFTIAHKAGVEVTTSINKEGFTVIKGDDISIWTKPNTKSKVILQGDNITFKDGEESKGSKSDEIKVFGDNNSISTAYKGKPAQTSINGDKIFLEGKKNEIELRSGNNLRIQGKLSRNNKVTMTLASNVSDASGSIILRSSNNFYVNKNNSNVEFPVASSIGLGPHVDANVHLDKGAEVTLRRPGRATQINYGVYVLNKDGEKEKHYILHSDFKQARMSVKN